MYGRVAANALGVSVYTLDTTLVQQFSSQVEAAKWLGVSNMTILRYMRSGKLFQGKYYIRNT
jgi:hypothetical protein